MAARKKASKKKARKKSSKKRAKKTSSVASHYASSISAAKRYNQRVTADSLISGAKRKRGKRWTCRGPVRSGCGGSNSSVVK